MFLKKINNKLTILETNLNDLVIKNIKLEKKNTELEKKNNELENKIGALNVTNNTEYINKLDNKLSLMSQSNSEMYNKYAVLLETCNYEIRKINKNIEKNTNETVVNLDDIERTLLKINELEEILNNNISNITLKFDTEVKKNREEISQINNFIDNLKNKDINLESQIEEMETNLEAVTETSDEKRGWRLFG